MKLHVALLCCVVASAASLPGQAVAYCDLVGPGAEEACRRGEAYRPRDDSSDYRPSTNYERPPSEPTKTPAELSARCAQAYDECIDDCTNGSGNSAGSCRVGCSNLMEAKGCM